MTTYALTAEQRGQLMIDLAKAYISSEALSMLQSLQPNTHGPVATTRPHTDSEKQEFLAAGIAGNWARVLAFNDRPLPLQPAEPLELSGDEILECEQLAVGGASSRNDLTIRTGRAILAAANAKRGVKP